MPDKVNAPAVSRLAGEIAEKIVRDERFIRVIGDYPDDVKVFVEIISAALSEREEKLLAIPERAAELCKGSLAMALNGKGNPDLTRKIFGYFDVLAKEIKEQIAALSALGESK